MNQSSQTVASPAVASQTAAVETQVRALVAEVLELDASVIHLHCRFREDLGADSLDLVTLIMAFSNAFDANVCDGDVQHIQTVGEAIAYLDQHSAGHPAK